MGIKFKNDAVSVLTGSLTTLSTDILINSADDGLFPVIAAIGADYFYLTLEDKDHNIEIVKIVRHVSGSNNLETDGTADSGVNRGLDGTTARSWAIGDVVEIRPNALALEEITLAADSHIADTVDAHDATAISYAGSTGLSATNVEEALDELDIEINALISAHLADASDAHDASAISSVPAGNLAASDVQAALNELDVEKAGLALKNVFTKSQGSAQVALTDGDNIATDSSLGNMFTVTLGGNRTLDNPSNLTAGFTYVWNINQDGTGNRTLAYGSVWKFPGGVAPVLSTGANAEDTLSCVYDGAILRCVISKGFA
jgi:hypothetical protein